MRPAPGSSRRRRSALLPGHAVTTRTAIGAYQTGKAKVKLATAMAGNPKMEIGERRLGSLIVLRPEGRLDSVTSPAFQERLLTAVESGLADVVVDFSAVDYVSSAGLRGIMTAAKLKPKGLRLAAIGLNPV